MSAGDDSLIDAVTAHTCAHKCFGIRGYSASCCMLEQRNFIQGPVDDVAETLARLSARFGRTVTFDEVFVEFEEGASLFPDRPRWQQPESYPALRPVMNAERGYPCQFLTEAKTCGIYEDRPDMCRRYRCDHLKHVLDTLL